MRDFRYHLGDKDVAEIKEQSLVHRLRGKTPCQDEHH